MTQLVALSRMSRPLIMVSVMLVYVCGNLMARAGGYAVDYHALMWGSLALLLVAASIHYANEYADYETDALTTRTRFSGGSQVLPRGIVPRQMALLAAWLTLLLGFGAALLGLAGGALSAATLLLLAIGALGGWMYSLPPLALAWRGWGEVDNAILGGMVLVLYGYAVQAGGINWQIILACLPFTLLVFNNLLATTWPDRHADRQVGKYTLATRLSVARLRGFYGIAAVLSFGLLLIFGQRFLPPEVSLGSLLVIPLVVWGYWRYTRQESPLPSVLAMITILCVQMIAWFQVGSQV